MRQMRPFDTTGSSAGFRPPTTMRLWPSQNRPFPPTQTITWGAKTLTGHGAHLLNYTGSGTLSITSQKDASNADVTIWQMGQNGLSWKGASATYNQPAPASLNGPYTVVVTDGTYRSTVTINILANAFSIREMTAVANGGRWATDSMYTVDGTATSGPTQLRTLLQNATLVRGDTIWCRDGIFNPTSANVRMRIKAGGYTGSGMITIRSDRVDASVDQYGMPNRRHGAEMRRLEFDEAVSGDIYFPIRLEDLWLSTTITSVDIVKYSSTGGWGVSTYNCRIAADPLLTATSVRGMVLRGSQTDVAYAQYNTLTNLSRGIVVFSSTGAGGAGRTKGALIQHNDAFGLYEDFITDQGEATVVEHNFARDWKFVSALDHPDGYQHFHDGVAPTTYDGPKVRYNIFVTNVDLADYSFQAYFTDDSASARTLTNVEFKCNIGTCLTSHGVTMARMTGPVAQYNTTLSLVTPGVDLNGDTTPTNTIISVPVAPKNGTEGTFNYNVANSISVAPQTGTVVSTPNAPLSSGGGATSYATAFPNWVETGITSRALAMAACTPANVLVASGGVKNPDGTYNGAIGPDGDWNTGAAY